MNVQQKSKGFTIIEVVLVLAIAGLIFLVVFLAVPALQRSQRDTQRREDAARVSTFLANYQANNSGKLPTAATEQTSFTTGYVKNAVAPSATTAATDEVKSPSVNTGYTMQWNAAAVTAMSATAESMQIAVGSKCNGEALTTAAGKYAVRVILEGGGTYCVGSN